MLQEKDGYFFSGEFQWAKVSHYRGIHTVQAGEESQQGETQLSDKKVNKGGMKLFHLQLPIAY